jgi:hypothetical protein
MKLYIGARIFVYTFYLILRPFAHEQIGLEKLMNMTVSNMTNLLFIATLAVRRLELRGHQ